MMLEVQDELAADERMRSMAERVVSAASTDVELEAGVFAPSLDERKARNALAHARIDWNHCELLASSHGDGHSHAVFGVRCAQGARELELGLDDLGRIATLEWRAPRAADAACWP